MKTPCCCHLDGHQHGGPKPTETSGPGFCYENVNSSLEEIVIMKKYFSQHNNCSDSKIFPK